MTGANTPQNYPIGSKYGAYSPDSIPNPQSLATLRAMAQQPPQMYPNLTPPPLPAGYMQNLQNQFQNQSPYNQNMGKVDLQGNLPNYGKNMNMGQYQPIVPNGMNRMNSNPLMAQQVPFPQQTFTPRMSYNTTNNPLFTPAATVGNRTTRAYEPGQLGGLPPSKLPRPDYADLNTRIQENQRNPIFDTGESKIPVQNVNLGEADINKFSTKKLAKAESVASRITLNSTEKREVDQKLDSYFKDIDDYLKHGAKKVIIDEDPPHLHNSGTRDKIAKERMFNKSHNSPTKTYQTPSMNLSPSKKAPTTLTQQGNLGSGYNPLTTTNDPIYEPKSFNIPNYQNLPNSLNNPIYKQIVNNSSSYGPSDHIKTLESIAQDLESEINRFKVGIINLQNDGEESGIEDRVKKMESELDDIKKGLGIMASREQLRDGGDQESEEDQNDFEFLRNRILQL
jgi:hypothetical protein